ncbi:MAG: hypothetical protein PHC50_03380 [Candidatus Cloacimonetes bacterium]|nr:hypothetical protein [Candidatus Cloacimonadota bacterium]
MNNPSFEQIYESLLRVLESRVYLIGSVIARDAARLAEKEGIRDLGDYIDSFHYIVSPLPDGFLLHVGSHVHHAPFIEGGKVPSWTPLAPLIAWVERKQLAWTDKKSGKLLSVVQMACLIRAKIKREGIPARDVFKATIDDLDAWITQQIDSITLDNLD